MEQPPQKSTARELTEKVIEGGIGAIPYVGSPLAVAFGYAMGYAHSKRMDVWMGNVASAIDELQKRGAVGSFDDLANDDQFVDAVIAASRAAQATSSEEKLAALRNGVLNCLGPGAPAGDEQLRFLRLIDEFTVSHVMLLRFLNDAGSFFDAYGLPRPNFSAGGKSSLLETVPEFKGRREWYDLLAADLAARGLANANLHAVMSVTGLWQAGTTSLGERFLRFIDLPTPLAD